VVIVGGGPAGAATALHLARHSPHLARRTLILEKAAHPRPKVCAGGLIPHTLDCLDELGIGLTVPHVTVERGRADVPARRVEIEDRRLCAVVRRAEFDAALIAAARARGVEVREREKVRDLVRAADVIRVETERGTYATPLVVGADGAGSLVRRRLVGGGRDLGAIGRGVMTDIPADQVRWDGHARARYDFDFRAVPAGLAGYAWLFPAVIGGRPHVNVGVYARRPVPGVDPVALLAARREQLGAAPVRHQAAPIRCYTRAPFTAANVLLVGDAAGVDPLMGEGISFAFEYGRWAADEIGRALAARDRALRGAETRFRRSWAGRKLRRLDQAATLLYGPGARLWLALAARWTGAQEIGLRWYNGVDGWDRRSGWQALRAALRRRPVASRPLPVH